MTIIEDIVPQAAIFLLLVPMEQEQTVNVKIRNIKYFLISSAVTMATSLGACENSFKLPQSFDNVASSVGPNLTDFGIQGKFILKGNTQSGWNSTNPGAQALTPAQVAERNRLMAWQMQGYSTRIEWGANCLTCGWSSARCYSENSALYQGVGHRTATGNTHNVVLNSCSVGPR